MARIPAIIAKTPVPERLPFIRGEEVIYSNLGEGSRWPTKIKSVVNVHHGDGTRTRYYGLESAPGVIVAADRLLHTWEA